MSSKVQQPVSFEIAKSKITRYCAYQERCHSEVKEKLLTFGITDEEVDELLVYLIRENFLNEERFARVYAGGKFRMKGWGRIKIRAALGKKGLGENCIRLGLRELADEDYLKCLEKLLLGLLDQKEQANLFLARNKAAQAAIRKGFEPELVWRRLRDLAPD